MDMTDITTALTGLGVTVYAGYPKTNAKLPYAVHRPLSGDTTDDSLCGVGLAWDFQHAIYCCGGSVEASYNLSLLVARTLQGKRLSGGSVLATSLGYLGAPVEGHYESQVIAQAYQGGI